MLQLNTPVASTPNALFTRAPVLRTDKARVFAREMAFMDPYTMAEYAVMNFQGEDIGMLVEVLIDAQDGEIAYGILGTGDLMDVQGESVAVPWGALTWDEDSACFVFNVEMKQFEHALAVEQEDWPMMVDPEQLATEYPYISMPSTLADSIYGLRPDIPSEPGLIFALLNPISESDTPLPSIHKGEIS